MKWLRRPTCRTFQTPSPKSWWTTTSRKSWRRSRISLVSIGTRLIWTKTSMSSRCLTGSSRRRRICWSKYRCARTRCWKFRSARKIRRKNQRSRQWQSWKNSRGCKRMLRGSAPWRNSTSEWRLNLISSMRWQRWIQSRVGPRLSPFWTTKQRSKKFSKWCKLWS